MPRSWRSQARDPHQRLSSRWNNCGKEQKMLAVPALDFAIATGCVSCFNHCIHVSTLLNSVDFRSYRLAISGRPWILYHVVTSCPSSHIWVFQRRKTCGSKAHFWKWKSMQAYVLTGWGAPAYISTEISGLRDVRPASTIFKGPRCKP